MVINWVAKFSYLLGKNKNEKRNVRLVRSFTWKWYTKMVIAISRTFRHALCSNALVTGRVCGVFVCVSGLGGVGLLRTAARSAEGLVALDTRRRNRRSPRPLCHW